MRGDEVDEKAPTVSLELSVSEVELMRTALEMLEDTLGREEADELEEVQELLKRLPAGS
jgi:hypothetical protein